MTNASVCLRYRSQKIHRNLSMIPGLSAWASPLCRAAARHCRRQPVRTLARTLVSLGDRVTARVVSDFVRDGFAVVDGAVDRSDCDRLRSEIEALYADGRLHANATHVVGSDGATTLIPKSSIWEAETVLPAVAERAPTLHALGSSRSLADALHSPSETPSSTTTMTTTTNTPPVVSAAPSPSSPPLLPRFEFQMVKAQLNEGHGGCFPLHFDSDPKLDGRRVTAILYLNEPPHAGGELELFPFPAKAVRVAPSMGRLVLFSSTEMLHRVLPSHERRMCCTTWLHVAPNASTGTGSTGSTGGTAGGAVGAGGAGAGGAGAVGAGAVGAGVGRGGPAAAAAAAAPELQGVGKAALEAWLCDLRGGGGKGASEKDHDDEAHAESRMHGSYGGGGQRPDPPLARAVRLLVEPRLRRHFLKLYYAGEWRASIEESHVDSPAREALLATHDREVGIITQVIDGVLREAGFLEELEGAAESGGGGAEGGEDVEGRALGAVVDALRRIAAEGEGGDDTL